MLEILCDFAIAFAISAVFTIPVTMVTAKIIQQSIGLGFRSAVRFIIGASIMEWVYAFIALILFEKMESLDRLNSAFIWASIPVLIALGTYHWKKSARRMSFGKEPIAVSNEIWSGLGFNLFNFLILPFWLVTLVWLAETGYEPRGIPSYIFFSTGATVGASVVFILYAYLGQWMSRRIQWISAYLDKGMSYLFFGLALIQLFTLLMSS
jgi:threonine/homoserine/homoserine lactone efflux protein